MKDKSILITDVDTPLGLELAKRFLESGNRITGTVSGDLESSLLSSFKDESFIYTKWSKHSSVSARNVVLTALNSYSVIDLAIIIQSTEAWKKMYHEIYSTTIEKTIDTVIKGTMFLTKEVLSVFSSSLLKGNREGNSVLAIAHHITSELNYLTPLEGFIRGGTEGFLRSLCRLNDDENIIIGSFSSPSADIRGYASFIWETLSENPGRINCRRVNYRTKKGFLRFNF